ncbi:MAG TPA: argininosuccinate lyase [bacterium]|nr:argininosuccinate lyase [bacterium]
MKLWNPKGNVNSKIEEYTVGNDYLLDLALVTYDCQASIAHAEMLGEIGILDESEVRQLVGELDHIITLAEEGQFDISPQQEDCHTAIENHLTQQLGDLGKKIHTARSRNDQVVTALRLYYRDQLERMTALVHEFPAALEGVQKQFGDVEIPGYTHTRKAMPSSVALWTGAFRESMQENLRAIEHVQHMLDQSPLGTGAGYGIPLEIDRQCTAEKLGFSRIQENSIYVQNSRGKFEGSILNACDQVMYDLNRMSSDLIFFSLPDFGIFELPEEICTGSSIMPQKHNPDVLELVRAKYHEVLGLEFQVKSLSANLISGYHRDLQLTKEPVMRGLTTTLDSLEVMILAVKKLRVNEERAHQAMTEDLYATQRVYELVKEGIPFREAYKEISKEY